MSRLASHASLAIALALAACSGGEDANKAATAEAEIAGEAAPAAAAAEEEGLRDPEAIAAMDRMSAALAKQTSFSLRSDITAEDVLTTGQKVQYAGTVDIAARRPDKMRMSLKMGDNERQLFYDGKTLTLSSPGQGYYASAEAPPTIKAMLDLAQERLGLQIPLADMFQWAENPEAAAAITSALYLGTETIGGNSCEHYAMRQKGADWQVWMREGENALPCKLVITMTTDPAMPQFSAVYNWSAGAAPPPEAFTFKPAAGANQIAFAKVTPVSERSGD